VAGGGLPFGDFDRARWATNRPPRRAVTVASPIDQAARTLSETSRRGLGDGKGVD